MASTIIYGLIAVGGYACFNGENKITSKKVFRTPEKAEAYKEAFIKKCCGNGLTDMDVSQPIICKVVEHELED